MTQRCRSLRRDGAGVFSVRSVSHAQPRLRRSRRRHQRGKGGPALGMLWQHPFGSRPGERESLGRDVTKERAMTKEKSYKRRVRERMSKTGESYTAARGHVAQKRDRVQSARTRLAAADERVSDAKVK